MEEGDGGGLTAHEIYMAMTGGPGSGTLDTAQHTSSAVAQLEGERAERIRRIAEKIQAGWQGTASEGAYGAAVPLADVTRDIANQLTHTDRLLGVQSGVFNSMRHSVREVPATPPQSNILNDMVPWETDLDRQIKQYQGDAQHNMRIYAMYDSASASNERSLPREYTPISDSGGSVSVKPPESQPGGPPPGGGYRPPAGPKPVQPGPGGGGSVSGSQEPSGPQEPNGGQAPNQGTDISHRVPPVLPPRQEPPGGLPPGGQPPSTGSGPVTGWPGPGAPVPVGGRGPGVGLGPEGRGGVSEGGPGGRGGGGVSEGGPGGRGAAGGPGVRGGDPGAGGRPGVGALAAEEAAARRGGVGAAGARGGAAGGGFGPMGAGRGQGGEDTEHERKSFLQEPDPEAIFGSDEKTAPPVIGEE